MKYKNIREEEIKNKIAQEYFWNYDCSKIVGNVDFCVCMWKSVKDAEQESLLWAEAKKDSSDIYKSIAQLTLTIGKARTFDKLLPPHFLGAFDGEKIAFVPYSDIQDIFYQNDFNWNVAASDYNTKEFQLILQKVIKSIDNKEFLFYYEKDDKELKHFIKTNFTVSKFGVTKIRIDKNNFITIYSKWLETVQPTIAVQWEKAKARGIIGGDFYLADLLSVENKTLREKLFVVLKTDHYILHKGIDEMGLFDNSEAPYSDNQKAHTKFWTKYERPPLEEYWDYIIDHRHLLVPQDVRERKGSFYTPKIWVELSQQYLADVLGEDWQDEYFIWDCAAGTGNLLNGLTNKYNIYASTLDKADVDIMKDRIHNGANLLEEHVFQFDFLNDDFTKLPQSLQKIINDEKKRKKLVVYINPPYSETNNKSSGDRSGVSATKIGEKYSKELGDAKKELFAQFFIRIYKEIPCALLAEFSKLKILQAPNFENFRNQFQAKIEKMFIVPARTFDNVTGNFPIGFIIWNTNKKEHFTKINSDAYDNTGKYFLKKTFYNYSTEKYINEWIKQFKDKLEIKLGILYYTSNDFQQQNTINISSLEESYTNHLTKFIITKTNLIVACIYYAVRKVIPATWLNDRDQFLYPNNGWEKDEEFQNDCLAYALFTNNISSKYGENHWIPFIEYGVSARDKFDSNFMTDFIAGKTMPEGMVSEPLLFYHTGDGGSGRRDLSWQKEKERKFSEVAINVFKAGRALWKYYHKQPKRNVNASLYDIREHFQGRDNKGKMNNTSDDETYNELNVNLRAAIKALAEKIEPKVYEYGFLKK